jgi:putative sterol carrier protein
MKSIKKKAKGFDSYYQLIAEPDPSKGVTEQRAAGLLLPQATETWEGIREDADYTMTAPYEVFYKIFTGKLGAILGYHLRQGQSGPVITPK